ncbi:molybdate transport system substrate-binding protein [Thermocatellispora tengchongensis]|uniref:Molybdate transport system substrate-binding protein n=1 Tax=Thermocatellispora tengchongensis TaxID=1073253 RepID=A0A840PIA9_9ACTN|nr:molybdate ABC transporter substrate-binding protein [Thermocatellispora tengchongensis]MBB5138872.1 molybdate transport system substrate-binding protein [Thermocatellispora tengchongensis]
MVSRRLSRWATALAAVLALAGVTACGSGRPAASASPSAPASGAKEVTVFAAASLTGTFTELGKAFEAANPGTTVRFNFGSSATLAQQIVQGAPADVFAAASPATMKTVTDAGLASAPATFVRNRLQIAVPAGNPAGVDELKDLADPKVKVALCAPQVPCGAAAVKALEAAGLKVTPVTLEQDVKATLTKVELGEVDAALVYTTDVIASGGEVRGIAFPEAGQAVNDYPIAALAKAPAGDLAGRFVDLVLSQRGKDVLIKAGFEAP